MIPEQAGNGVKIAWFSYPARKILLNSFEARTCHLPSTDYRWEISREFVVTQLISSVKRLLQQRNIAIISYLRNVFAIIYKGHSLKKLPQSSDDMKQLFASSNEPAQTRTYTHSYIATQCGCPLSVIWLSFVKKMLLLKSTIKGGVKWVC